MAVAAATYLGLRLWGSQEGSTDQIVVAAVALPVSFLVLPILELFWHFLWAPWVQLKEDVQALQLVEQGKAEPKATKAINVRITLRNQARAGRDLLKRSRHLGPYALQAEAASAWTNGVVEALAKYCDSDAAEAFLDAADHDASFQEQMKDRIEKLEELAAEAPARQEVPKEN